MNLRQQLNQVEVTEEKKREVTTSANPAIRTLMAKFLQNARFLNLRCASFFFSFFCVFFFCLFSRNLCVMVALYSNDLLLLARVAKVSLFRINQSDFHSWSIWMTSGYMYLYVFVVVWWLLFRMKYCSKTEHDFIGFSCYLIKQISVQFCMTYLRVLFCPKC